MRISVCLSTRRYGGLLRQIEFFRHQTFPLDEFEIVIIDGLYWNRENEIRSKAAELGLNLKYSAPRELNRKISIDHPSMRNSALVLADGELIVFFDDYQIPSPQLLSEHWKIYKKGYCCQGRQFYFDAIDFDSMPAGATLPLKKSNNPDLGYIERRMPPVTFYTHNCSAPLKELIKINGFDERYASGNGGEDYDAGMRLGLIGNKMMYNPNALCYHMEHTSIKIYPACPDICGFVHEAQTKESFLKRYPTMREKHIQWIDWDDIGKYAQNGANHDRSLIYNHPNFTGKFSTPTLETWDENGLIFCRCKVCGWEGVIDSIPLFHWNVENKNSQAPKKYFDLNLERQKIAEKD